MGAPGALAAIGVANNNGMGKDLNGFNPFGPKGGGGGFVDPGMRPDYAGYTSLNGPDNKIAANLQSTFNPNTQALEALRANSLSTSPSPWAQAQLAQQGLTNAGLKDSALNQAASQAAQARSGLASKYGLSQGAAERLATQGQRAGMNSLQNVGFQGAQANAAIGAQDALNKQNQLAQLPGMENALAAGKTGADQFNIQNSINQNTAKNTADLAKYQEQMRAYAAGQQGNIMASQGGGGKK